MIYMDENRKEAIATLNRLYHGEQIDEEEYFTLLSFVVAENPQVTYIPIQYEPVFPHTTWQDNPLKYEVTCKDGLYEHHNVTSI